MKLDPGVASEPAPGGSAWSRVNRRRIYLSLGSLPFFFALFLFLPAGTFFWSRAWVFLAVALPSWTVATVYLWRTNPEVIIARSHRHEGTKSWDKILLACLALSILAIYPVAALDAVRYQWSSLPAWVSVIGHVLFLLGLALSTWALKVNKFFEPTVRIQTDRGHVVIDSGPYAHVRHPGYVAAMLIFTGFALALGSLWALVPVALVGFVLVVRTELEDKTLADELQGYRGYQRRVRHKLVPYVW
ncbi:MAG: methyltransferase family protein [Methyloligellaceae bacterium]